MRDLTDKIDHAIARGLATVLWRAADVLGRRVVDPLGETGYAAIDAACVRSERRYAADRIQELDERVTELEAARKAQDDENERERERERLRQELGKPHDPPDGFLRGLRRRP